MRTALLSLAVSGSLYAGAQQVAQDFNRADCDGTNHHLYQELDSGKAIILDYVMIGTCYSCINATSRLQDIVADFELTHPGLVKLYTIGYNNSYSCTQIMNWEQTNSLTPSATFDKGSSDVTYYGGMGMPTVVVVGGGGRNVFYKNLGFSDTDTTAIKTAIGKILTTTGTGSHKAVKPLLFPNPGSSATLQIPGLTPVWLTITDLNGRILMRVQAEGENGIFHLPAEGLAPGVFLISASTGNETYYFKWMKI